MTLSASVLGDSLGDSLGDQLGDSFGALSAESILGDSYRLEYNPAIFTPGPGGIAAIANQQGDSDFDALQATAGNQPDAVTVGGHAAAEFITANVDALDSIATGTAGVIGDYFAWFMVLKVDIAAVAAGFGEVVNGAANTGAVLYQQSGNMIGRTITTTGTVLRQTAFTDTTNIQVVRWEVRSDRFHLTINGSKNEFVAATGGINEDLKITRLGHTSQPTFDGKILYATFALNPTVAQSDDYLAFLEGIYL